MKWRLIVYGLLAMALALSIELRAYRVDSPDTEMVIIVNPRNPLNPVVKNPYQDEYEQMLYPVVRISAGWSTGSGVVISVERRACSVEGIAILTAAHVVGNESEVNIEANDKVLTATVVITDTVKDLALLRPSQPLTFKAHLAPRDYTAYVFTPIYTIGCSLGLSPRPSCGIISVVEPDLPAGRHGHWEVTSPILPGNSGGPVFDKRTYEVIGIAVWVKVYNGQLVTTMAGVVPINQIYEFLNETTNGHKE